ncbi:MAG: hypothetical protein HZT40_10370 [Candidatus Thiothrix singaporensis]|uniref:Uncharacterized protein n=1 Tax=Candidatus Thiothrix singaporensis TaxID=2799669 RepID=A0A7L6ASN0_9GAMM|nr:MAG: hypothetical protein HZT40_10370 [Candidatus Thiothrix singaporensis]
MIDFRPCFGSLTLAGYGWEPADWSLAFYPDDLPPDWRVPYYAAEFNSVLLPAGGWQAPLMDAAFWLSELDAGFSYYVEINHELMQSGVWAQVQVAVERYLREQVVGLLVENLAMPALPVAWKEYFPVHILQPGQLLADMPPIGAMAQIALLRASQPLSPMALRNVFEQMQQGTSHRDIVLFVDASWATVGQIRLMQQLYGV